MALLAVIQAKKYCQGPDQGLPVDRHHCC